MSEPESGLPAGAVAPECGRWSTGRSLAVLLGLTAAFAALLLAHNRHLFSHPIHEEGDPASVSLLVVQAKKLELVHGHYSRVGFYHPGPGLLYVLAAAEYVFHDLSGIVPAPHNAHIIGHLLLSAVLLGVSLTVIARATKSALAGAGAGLAFLVYFASEGHLGSHWFAYVFFLVYLAFQVSAASVASGRAGHLGWLALTGGLAVHCHVSFVAFVVPIGAYVVVRLWVKERRAQGAPGGGRRAWVVFAAVLGLFALPIVLHTVLHYPGEIGRYVHFTRQAKGGASADAVGTFLLRTLTHESRLGWGLALAVGAGALAAVVTVREPQRSFARQLAAVMALSSAAMVYYAARGVDRLEETYVGIFFGSVLLLGWALIGMRLATAFDRGPVARGVALAVGGGVAVWAGLTGTFTNPYAGAAEVPALADAICADPRWANGPPAVTFDDRCWSQAAALLVELERRGQRPWVVDRKWDVVCTDRFRLAGRTVTGLWHIDVVPSQEAPAGARRVLGELGGASFREVDPCGRIGEPLVLGPWGRQPTKPETGWAAGGNLTHLLAVSKRASVLLELEKGRPKEVRLTIRARGVAPTKDAAGQRVGVIVNGERVGDVTFPFGRAEERALVFAGVVLDRGVPVRIEFELPDAGGYRSGRAPGPPELYSIELLGLTFSAAAP